MGTLNISENPPSQIPRVVERQVALAADKAGGGRVDALGVLLQLVLDGEVGGADVAAVEDVVRSVHVRLDVVEEGRLVRHRLSAHEAVQDLVRVFAAYVGPDGVGQTVRHD